MKRLLLVFVLILTIGYIGVHSFGTFKNFENGSVALLMQGVTQKALNETIIGYYKKNIVEPSTELLPQMIKKTVVDINGDGRKDVIATIESKDTCGSGGCIASIFVTNDIGELMAIPFSYATKEIRVLDTITGGMHDLRINSDTEHRMIWNGTTYELEQI